MTIVDLSLPIGPHVRWATQVTVVTDFEDPSHVALPLRLEAADGAPARAIAILD
ncbi:MAG: hypothetical protein ACREMB_26635 [Candidatus Rokuibacteriota bacterium]